MKKRRRYRRLRHFRQWFLGSLYANLVWLWSILAIGWWAVGWLLFTALIFVFIVWKLAEVPPRAQVQEAEWEQLELTPKDTTTAKK